jgi:hypothetical protein
VSFIYIQWNRTQTVPSKTNAKQSFPSHGAHHKIQAFVSLHRFINGSTYESLPLIFQFCMIHQDLFCLLVFKLSSRNTCQNVLCKNVSDKVSLKIGPTKKCSLTLTLTPQPKAAPNKDPKAGRKQITLNHPSTQRLASILGVNLTREKRLYYNTDSY